MKPPTPLGALCGRGCSQLTVDCPRWSQAAGRYHASIFAAFPVPGTQHEFCHPLQISFLTKHHWT